MIKANLVRKETQLQMSDTWHCFKAQDQAST